MLLETQKQKALKLLKLFKIDGVSADEKATDGQIEIFYNLVWRPKKRLQIICSTQYGKSLITAFACLILSCIKEELVAVIAPTNEKAKIIMRYYIEHLGDHPVFYSQLEKNTKLERLRQEESKDRIILRNDGGIYTLSVQAGNSRKMIEAAMGEGAENVIQDESCLIPDQAEATIFRMIAGKRDGFYCKIGNPFYAEKPYGHFNKSWRDPNYKKIFIDYEQGIREGRYSEEFIDEARHKPHFDILFECKFPEINLMDKAGYSSLLTKDDLDRAYEDEIDIFGDRRLGVDVAGGGRNYSVIVLRGTNGARVLYREKQPDTMSFAGEIKRFIDELVIKPNNVFVDSVGIGRGVYDRLAEICVGEDYDVRPVAVNVGEAAKSEEFMNLRAENYWNMAQWIKGGGLLERHPSFEELLNIKYKTQSDKKIKIMSKEEMLKIGIESPDVADALMLTFSRPKNTGNKITVFKPGVGQLREMPKRITVFRPH